MSLFATVAENEATGKVKAVYEDIKATKGIDFVPNFWMSFQAPTASPMPIRWSRMSARIHPDSAPAGAESGWMGFRGMTPVADAVDFGEKEEARSDGSV